MNLVLKNTTIFEDVKCHLMYFNNESQLELFDVNGTGGNLDFGIIFDEIPTEKLSYKIRTKDEKLPSAKERTNDGTQCRPTGNNFGTGNGSIYHCNPTNYYYSGFLGFQAATDFSWISLMSSRSPIGNIFNFPQEILLQLVPKNAFVGGTFTVLRSIIPLYLVISLSQFVPPMLLVVEKK